MAPHAAATSAASPFAAAGAAATAAAAFASPTTGGTLLQPFGSCGWQGGAYGSPTTAATSQGPALLGAQLGASSPFGSQPLLFSASAALPDFGSLSLGAAGSERGSPAHPPPRPILRGPPSPYGATNAAAVGRSAPGGAAAYAAGGGRLGSPAGAGFGGGGPAALPRPGSALSPGFGGGSSPHGAAASPPLHRSVSADVAALAAAQGGFVHNHPPQQQLYFKTHQPCVPRAQLQQQQQPGGGRGGAGSPQQQPLRARLDAAGCCTAVCPVFDMKSLATMLGHVQAGTGDVRRVLTACTFKPRLPGLTKLVSNLTKEGHWAKALEVYHSLDAVGVRPDTTITNAAISSCDKGGQWEAALELFRRMADVGMARDAITYSALISALSKGRQWGLAIHVFNHMVQEGVECDAVTCCSLITALDKGGQWQMAEQVFKHMYCADASLAPLLEGMDDTPCGAGSMAAASMQGAFSLAALDALSGGGGGGNCGAPAVASALPPAEELAAGLVAAPRGPPPPGLLAPAAPALGAAPGSPPTHRCPGGSPPLAPGTPSDDGARGRDQNAHGAAAAQGLDKVALPSPPQAALDAHRVSPGWPASPKATAAGADGRAAASPGACRPSAFTLFDAGAGAVRGPANGVGAAGFGAALTRAGSGCGLTRAGSLSTKKASPNRVCCNALLASYARATPAQWRRALALLAGMWACGGELTPDIVSYNTAIKAAGSAHQADVAFELYHDMLSRGIEPTAATFGALLTLASEVGAWGRVVQTWGWLQASGLPVHVGCANTYLGALLKLGDWPTAMQVFAGMKACGGSIKPNTATFNLLIAACSDSGHVSMALDLFDDLVASNLAPNQATLSALAAAHARAGDWQRVGGVLRHMGAPTSGAPPTAATYAPLFRALMDVAANAASDAERASVCTRAADLYSLMLEQGVAADTPLYGVIVAAFGACGADAMVLRLALTLAERRWPMDEPTLGRALQAAAAQGAWDLAPRLLRGAMEGGARLPIEALRALLVQCAAAQAWSAAESIIQCCSDSNQLDEVAAGFPRVSTAGGCQRKDSGADQQAAAATAELVILGA